MTERLRVPYFSLEHTLECGQFFRFTKVLNTYIVQSSNRIFSISQRGESLFYEGVEEPFLIQFFRLDEDLDFIYKEIDQDPIIHQAIKKYRGMRLIRQDPWECLTLFLVFLCQSHFPYTLHDRSPLQILWEEGLFGKLSWVMVFQNPIVLKLLFNWNRSKQGSEQII